MMGERRCVTGWHGGGCDFGGFLDALARDLETSEAMMAHSRLPLAAALRSQTE
jgi:hypothetical protein